MPLRIAYVIGGSVSLKLDYLIDSGQHPRHEYNVFLSRNDADSISTDNISQGRSIWAKIWTQADQPLFALAAVTHERVLKYDAVITSGEDIGIPIALGAIFDALTVPVYIITHGSFFGSRKFALVCQLLRRVSTVHFLCLSDALCQRLIGLGIPADRVHNTGYGIDTGFFIPNQLEESPLIVSAGAASRDYATLIAATDGLGVDVKIAADSAWFPHSAGLDGKELPAYVEARSYGNYAGLRDLYARASMVVVPLQPAVHASGYAVIAEAMAMGKAVIATRTAAPPDFIVDGETGFFVEPGDTAGMREKIELLLADPARAAAMGAAGRARIDEQFSLDAYCRRIEAVLAG
ncbi:MAG: glycosyltransferase family 4 protein [Capsulimonadaceae bacterium]|nr:glycosyltransferase family 4 protein [Capsulimonadaceae bacterium]